MPLQYSCDFLSSSVSAKLWANPQQETEHDSNIEIGIDNKWSRRIRFIALSAFRNGSLANSPPMAFGLPEDALIIPPIGHPGPRDSPGNTPGAPQLTE
jgi:hypothetical protein